eukprot:scaffold18884_cov72-Skeletonema_dohrnii-CCMP3373.AAC.1
MPRPQKRQKLEDGQTNNDVPADDISTSSFDRLGTDELANIFGFLRPEDIMLARLNNKMREAAKKTIVPMTRFRVRGVRKFNAMAAMSTALPHLQQIEISYLNEGHKYSDGRHYLDREHTYYSDGEDPEEDRSAYSASWITYDIEILIRFRKLRILEMHHAPLNGRYPFLFNFPLLQQLKISCYYLKWNLEMLAGLPLLKELYCHCNNSMTGNINSLRVLKDTLAVVHISLCHHVQGNFMDLADFPRLRTLNLRKTSVTGDIRDIGEGDFPSLESLALPKRVYGGKGYEFQHISDAHGIAMAVYSIKKQRPSLLIESWHASLSADSPDWYGLDDEFDEYYVGDPSPPLHVRLVAAGSRVGYRWETFDGDHPCKVNWLDPEPDRESSDYEKYIEELHKIERQVQLFRGFHQPPSEEEFHRLEFEFRLGQNDE